MDTYELRNKVIQSFNDSAAMPGNEQEFENRLQEYEAALFRDFCKSVKDGTLVVAEIKP